jgi:hypothetical protein
MKDMFYQHRVCRVCLLYGLCFFLLTGAMTHAAGEKITVKPLGLRIVKPGYGDDGNELRPFNWFSGTSLSLLVVKPAGGFISFDDKKSELKSFVDDKGASLLEKKETGGFSFGRRGFDRSPDFSRDGRACLVEVQGPACPKTGATAIMASGTLVFQCGSKTRDVTQKGVALKEGTVVKAGPLSLTIKKVGKPDWGDDPMAVTFKADRKLGDVKGIIFKDAQGKVIGTSPGGTSTMRFGGRVAVEKTINFKEAASSATMVVTFWTDMKTISVPFKIKTGVGL